MNHLQIAAENMYDASRAERWAYFLQDADKLITAEEFAACDAAQLKTIADELQQQVRARNS
jgi:hypothetical protein